MRTSAHTRNAVSISTAVAFLAARGSNLGATDGIPERTTARPAFSHHQTFAYTGAKQTFAVPNGVRLIKVNALAGNGGGGSKNQVRVATAVALPPRSLSLRRNS